MKHFIGIDLGTTNSAVCSYDGRDVRIWKSPEQNDVTPSAIYIDKRSKYIGRRAYESAAQNEKNAAVLFKRAMGTSTPFKFQAANLTMSPEECSAEILKTLYGYLPEEIRNHPDTGTVITVPAAFDTRQKDATMKAAELAGIGRVALMQEPVAAVMTVMRVRKNDGTFLIYDLGGGTLDVAIAESIGGRVNLLSHGGIAMCGGRDFDRTLVDNIVRPWLRENFDLPEDFPANPAYKGLMRLATWATECAKIELSAREEVVISLSDHLIRTRDSSGSEIYLDIPLRRADYDALIATRVDESIVATRKTLEKAGYSSSDLECVVFVGGPTNYKPLRDKVAYELGLAANTDVNPMTAVAEGASVFAESIDWSSVNRSRKSNRGSVSVGSHLDLTFNYQSRTPSPKAKIIAQLTGKVADGAEFQIDSLDTGWTSGRIALANGTAVEVLLPTMGENTFKVFVFDPMGGAITLNNDKIIITRTAATVDAIPASHSIGVEVREKKDGPTTLEYLVRAGDLLPKKGKKKFKATETIRAGSADSLHIKLWEGEIEDVVSENRPIGDLKISGSDFEDGIIPVGADIECEYEVLDSGNVVISVSVPCIGGTFNSGKNFYSSQEGQMDFSTAAPQVIEEGERTLDRIKTIEKSVDDENLDKAQYATLVAKGNDCLKRDDMDALRQVVGHLYSIRTWAADENDIASSANIMRG